MRLGRPVAPIVLTTEERDTLERWARRPTTALALRARLVLRCAAGETATAIARDVHVTKQTVGKWRGRFLARRLDGLLDEPRPGVPRKITAADVERVLTATLESTPRDATHWSAQPGQAVRRESDRDRAHLEGGCPAAASRRHL
jgi:transposase